MRIYDTNADGRWAGDSRWRNNAVELGFPTQNFPFAARYDSNPLNYLVAFTVGGLQFSYGLITPLNPSVDLYGQLIYTQMEFGPFPWGYPVEPDH